MLTYLHIPFCEQKCYYCAFNSFSNIDQLKTSYFHSLIKQLKSDLHQYNIQKNSISSLFIGGGTPSCIDANAYEEFFILIAPYLKEDCEITSEANPNSATYEWLKKMRKLGVNRLSFGVQSFNDKKLKFLGRSHLARSAKEAIYCAKEVGFENISLDLIYGSKFDDKKNIDFEVKNLANLPINHLSAYSLTLEKNTPFYKKTHLLNDDFTLANHLFSSLKDMGFTQYEISNFGKPCRHNVGYWEHKAYLGIGAGAVGFDGEKRYYPQKDVAKYIQNLHFKDEEILTKNEILTEKIFLGLRCNIGIKKDILSQKQLQNAKILLDENRLYERDKRYFSNDFLLADEIALFLLQ